MKKIGVVGIPGGWSSEKLADAVAERTGFRLLVDPGAVRLDLPSGRVLSGEVELNSLDGLIIKKIGKNYSPDLLDRLEIFRFLAGQGMPIFSSPLNIIRVLDRLTCTISLQLAGIPMPPLTITEDVDVALDAVTAYGEAVFKPLYSTKARGMFVLRPGMDARTIVEEYAAEHRIMYIQKKIELNGRDLGVVFLGGRYLTTYARSCRNDSWNTTTVSGGRYQPHEPSEEIIALAHRAQTPFGLDFTCVDVVESADGPMVFEVSAFGGFRGIQEACGIDAAKHYADYVCGRVGA